MNRRLDYFMPRVFDAYRTYIVGNVLNFLISIVRFYIQTSASLREPSGHSTTPGWAPDPKLSPKLAWKMPSTKTVFVTK